MNLNDIYESLMVKSVLVAFAILVVGQFALSQATPSFTHVALAIVVLPLVAFICGRLFDEYNVTNTFIIGILAYAVFAFSQIFFKMTELQMVEEAKTGAIFAALCVGAYLELR